MRGCPAGVASVAINLPATAQEQASSDVGTLDQGAAEKLFPKKRAYSPYAGRNFPSRPFFGDTHLHTSFSFDAGAFGARLGPVDAYRFAKGEQVVASSGQPAKLSRPLDFLVVADHSDNIGFFPDLLAAKPNIMADPTGRKWHDMIVGGQGAAAAIEIIVAFSQNKFPKALLYSPDSSSYRSAWQETIRAAEQANEPGRFTAFRSPAVAGYTKGVPMGGDLGPAPSAKAPTFLVAALKDPIGANLDRYQIVKGWVDAKGDVQEKVYDVAWSGDRKPGIDGKVPPVGSTVDVANATWTNTIGAPELIAVWTDPDFDPAQRAFYYGRVLEIPTPRWTAYDAKYFNVKMGPEVTMQMQERAYTSSI
jgi:Protein of unknown function (DUF3604)